MVRESNALPPSPTPSDDRLAHPAPKRRVWGMAPWSTALYVTALLITIPAFYLSLSPGQQPKAVGLYGLSASLLIGLHWWHRHGRIDQRLRPSKAVNGLFAAWAQDRQWDRTDAALIASLLLCIILPASAHSEWGLAGRVLCAMVVLAQLIRLFQQLLVRTGLAGMVFLASGVLFMCGAGFYWLDPSVSSLEDGLWLAFTTAATVGYGDVIPSTTASRIFSVFVVLLGAGVLSLITATIAAFFVKTQERELERDIMRELHREIKALRAEIKQLQSGLPTADQTKAAPTHSEPAPIESQRD